MMARPRGGILGRAKIIQERMATDQEEGEGGRRGDGCGWRRRGGGGWQIGQGRKEAIGRQRIFGFANAEPGLLGWAGLALALAGAKRPNVERANNWAAALEPNAVTAVDRPPGLIQLGGLQIRAIYRYFTLTLDSVSG
jgi:hypothetical protein